MPLLDTKDSDKCIADSVDILARLEKYRISESESESEKSSELGKSATDTFTFQKIRSNISSDNLDTKLRKLLHFLEELTFNFNFFQQLLDT